MNENEKFESDLRKRTDVDNLLTIKVKTTTEGRELAAKITNLMGGLINEMRDDELNNTLSEIYNDVCYDLNKARKNIQSQMVKLVRNK